MLKTIKHLIREGTPKKIREFLAYREGDEYSTKTFSQEGEDILLKRIFGEKREGFYVDVGAHHPFRFSNTKLLYDRGWRGINIEPNSELYQLFLRERKRDVNVNLGVGLQEGPRIFYSRNNSAVSTFSSDIAKTRPQLMAGSEPIEVTTLAKILDKYLPEGTRIDLLTIDVEGLDFEVIQSNDWLRYKPYCVLIEDSLINLNVLNNSKVYNFLTGIGYKLNSKLQNTCLYLLE